MNNSWKRKRDKLKQKFEGLADKDFSYKVGHELEMIKKLKNKLEKSTKELLGIFIEF